MNHQLADILARRMQRVKDEQDSEDVDPVEEAVENTESIPSNSTPPSSPPLIQARTEYDVGSVSYIVVFHATTCTINTGFFSQKL